MPRVAMEQSLNYLKNYLISQGVEVTDLNQQTGQVDAVIISGQDKDVMGMEDITSKVPVINARGLTPDLSAYQPEYRQTNGLDLKEKLTDSLFNDKLIFNPYEDLTWLLNNENNLSITKNQLILSLKQKQEVLFVGSKYDRQVQFAFPVIGYQSWDDQNYITLYDETLDLIRYVPFKDAQAFGTFYLHP